MQVAQITYLHFVDYTQLVNWSTRYLTGKDSGYNKSYTLKPLSSFLTKSREVVTIQDDEEYSRVTVKIKGGGVLLRDKELGKNIGTKRQFLVKPGQFIISKIDARNGAIGIIPVELDGAIVTNDFPLFDIDTTAINPDYLRLITTTDVFIKIAHSSSSGTTNRQRVDVDDLLQHEIPLPSLTEQEKLIADYNQKIRQAEHLSLQGIDLEHEIEDYFYNELGLGKNKKNTKKGNGISFVDFSSLQKWGIDFLRNESEHTNTKLSFFPIKELCKISSGGTPNRNIAAYYEDGTIPWIKTGELRDNILTDTEEKITLEGLQNSSAKIYKKGALVIAMYGATIGKTAKLGIDATTNQACAVMFDFKEELIFPDFLWQFLQTQTEKLKGLAYGSAQPNLNAGIIGNYSIPLPDLKSQQKIVENVTNLKMKIAQIESQAIKLKQQAQQEFEKAIFS